MSFDALAPHYRWLELVLAADKLQVCRTAFLGEVSEARRVLILGEGNGRFLAQCRRRLEHGHVTCVDASARMLALAKRRVERSGLSLAQVEFIHADALEWAVPRETFDLIVTHFFLDCFRAEQLESLLVRLAGAARPHAHWLLADFRIPERGLARRRAQVIHSMMYTFFRTLAGLPARRLTPPDGFLRAQGFELARRQIKEWGLLHTDYWVRRPGRWPGPVSPAAVPAEP